MLHQELIIGKEKEAMSEVIMKVLINICDQKPSNDLSEIIEKALI